MGAEQSSDRSTVAGAARVGDLDEVRRLVLDGGELTVEATANAAYGGHLGVLKWLRQQSCPWDESTCIGAATTGGLEALKWARAHGCPWDEWTTYWARARRDDAMYDWAVANGCPVESAHLG